MHYAEFAEDEVCHPCESRKDSTDESQSAALMQAIKDYEDNKWKVIGQKVGNPGNVRVLRTYSIHERTRYIAVEKQVTFRPLATRLDVTSSRSWPAHCYFYRESGNTRLIAYTRHASNLLKSKDGRSDCVSLFVRDGKIIAGTLRVHLVITRIQLSESRVVPSFDIEGSRRQGQG